MSTATNLLCALRIRIHVITCTYLFFFEVNALFSLIFLPPPSEKQIHNTGKLLYEKISLSTCLSKTSQKHAYIIWDVANAWSRVRVGEGYSEEFEVKVGVHQGSVLSPLLFIIVLEALS